MSDNTEKKSDPSSGLKIILIIFVLFVGAYIVDQFNKSDTPKHEINKVTKKESSNYTDSQICEKGKATLQSLGMDIKSVKLADGRSNGGVRALIVTYYSDWNSENHIKEVVQGLELGYTLNKKMSANLSETILVIGNISGKTRAMITSTPSNAGWFIRTKDSEGYLKKWSVTRYDKTFLSTVSTVMGW